MYRSTFFDTFFSDAEAAQPDEMDTNVATLQGQVQMLTRNVFDLQLVVAALIDTLHRIELADPAKLRVTVEEELMRAREHLAVKSKAVADKRAADAKAAGAAHNVWETGLHQAAAGDTTCDKCKKVVPKARTNFTADGTVCDLCAAGIPA